MEKRNGFMDYVRAAFHARPAGMFIPPNWIALGVIGLLGTIDPGFWVLGLGLELGYLFLLSTSARFQRLVDGKALLAVREKERQEAMAKVRRLNAESQRRLAKLQANCEAVLQDYAAGRWEEESLLRQHTESMNRFVWLFFQLLLTREGIVALAKEGKFSREARRKLEAEIEALEEQVVQEGTAPELARSLEGKLAILRQRLENLAAGEQQYQYVESELSRIEQQVELLRERALLQRDGASLSAQIDSVGASLGETADWIRTQRNLFEATEDLTEEPPPLLTRTRATREEA
jgi:hypothetical protein